MHRPTMSHWVAVKRIFCYLKGTIIDGLFLRYGLLSLLHGYFDDDWAGNPDDRCSVSGYAIF